MPASPIIVWFRRDLRLTDNPALHAGWTTARETGAPLILLYVLETNETRLRSAGGASKWWLDKSLRRLSADIETLGGALILRRGRPDTILDEIIETTGAAAIHWNRRYGGPERDADAVLKVGLKDKGLAVESHNASLLTEPWTFKTGSGGHYRVFTPYWKAIQASYTAPEALGRPDALDTVSLPSDRLDDWGLHPTRPDWSTGFDASWTPGEAGAANRLDRFLSGPVSVYADQRNRPDITTGTSGLSPHLAFGEIGPAQIWRATKARIAASEIDEKSAMVFLSELVWREFSYVLLYHHPELASENYNKAFEAMPWRDSAADYTAWCHGQTGFPVVDAGMRQLWQTGWMHNRVRMIVASFLTKHLLLPWQKGEAWFWDTLVDADPAANAASWQWTAGSGADAAPYFRVFNPITQGEKFDETGDYVRRFCPELAGLPNKNLFSPWTADAAILEQAGVTLGETYPHPIVDHKVGRERALTAYEAVKAARS